MPEVGPSLAITTRTTPVWGWATLVPTGDPWSAANVSERAEAVAVTAVYADAESPISAARLSELFQTRPWRTRQARWLAMQGGLIVRQGRDLYAVTPKGQRLIRGEPE